MQPDPADRRTTARRARLRLVAPYLAVVVTVLIANLAPLTGATRSDPSQFRSGLQTSVSAGLVPGTYTLDPNDGFTAQALGVGAAHQLVSGQLPWWNPYEGLGAPLAAEMQSAALFPGTLLRLLPGGGLLLRIALEVLAGCATVVVLRRLGLTRTPAAVGGVLFALNGVLAWFQHAAALPVAFLPILVWGLERAWSGARERRVAGVLVTAGGLALSLYAGFPETAYLSGLLAGIWFCWRLVGSPGSRWRFTLTSAAGALLGVMLAAPVVLPFAEYVARAADVGGHAADFAHRGLPAAALGNLVAPYAYGPIGLFSGSDQGGVLGGIWGDIGGYATIALIALAAVGVTGRHLRGLRLALAAWTVLAVGKTFQVPALSTIVGLVPGTSLSAFYRYAYASWIFALVVLAALGLDDAVRGRLSMRRVAAAGGFAALVLAAAAWVGRHVVERVTDPWAHLFFLASLAWAGLSVVLLCAGLMAVRGPGRVLAVRGVGALLVVEAVVMFAFPTLSAPRGTQTDTQLVGFLHTLARDGASGADLGRVYSLTDRLQPNYGTYLGVAQLNVNDLPIPSAWSRYVAQRLDPTASPILFLARSLEPATLAAAEQRFVDHVDGYRAAGVEYVITPAGGVPPAMQGVLHQVLATPTATVSRLAGTQPYAAASGCSTSARSRTQLQLDCPAASTLVRRELAMPGWTATVDGRTASVRTVDDTFQAVDVPAGSHIVVFRYVAPGATAGIALGAVGAALAIGFLGWQLLRRRRGAA